MFQLLLSCGGVDRRGRGGGRGVEYSRGKIFSRSWSKGVDEFNDTPAGPLVVEALSRGPKSHLQTTSECLGWGNSSSPVHWNPVLVKILSVLFDKAILLLQKTDRHTAFQQKKKRHLELHKSLKVPVTQDSEIQEHNLNVTP